MSISIGVFAPRIQSGIESAPQQCVKYLTKQLDRTGEDITFIGYDIDGSHDQPFDGAEWISVPRIPWQCERAIDDAGFDIVLCYRLTDQVQPVLVSTPTILWYHGDEHWEIPEYVGKTTSYALRALETWRVMQFDHVVCVSEDLRQRMVDRYPRMCVTTSTVANGIDHDVFRPVDDTPFDSPNDQPYICHVSSFDAKKNPQGVVRSFAHLDQEVQLVICGPGWADNDVVLTEIDQLGIEASVTFTGWVSQETLVKFISNSEAMIYPSLHETFGLPVIESMACGTPVVTSDRYAIPDIAGDAALLADPTDYDALASCLEQILTGSSRDLSQRGRDHAANFSWTRAAKEMTAEFRQIASQ